MTEPGKILIIDDSEVVLARAKQALSAAGYDVISTTQTVGNARHLRECDLVIIDFHMPGINGGSVVKSLRAALEGAGRECLLYLYTSDPAIADAYAKKGFDGSFVDKGDVGSLVSQVSTVFRMKRMRELSKGRASSEKNKPTR